MIMLHGFLMIIHPAGFFERISQFHGWTDNPQTMMGRKKKKTYNHQPVGFEHYSIDVHHPNLATYQAYSPRKPQLVKQTSLQIPQMSWF